MPRSSRHKSHKQSKHSSKEAKDYYADSDEDVRMKERNSGKEDGSVSVRVLKDSSHSASGEKRKLSSSLGKDGKVLSGNGNGDAVEEYVPSKRRKDKAEAGGRDRCNGGGDEKDDAGGVEKEIRGETLKIDAEKGIKSKESKGLGDSKSKSSKRSESGVEKEERKAGLLMEKEERSGSSRGESKRKNEKEYGRKDGKESKEAKEKDRGFDREKKVQESKLDAEVLLADGVLVKKQGSRWEDGGEDRQGKRGRENTDLSVQDDSEKEIEKRIRWRSDGSGDRDGSQDARDSDERHYTSREDNAKDGRYKDERYKDASFVAKNQDDVEKDDWHPNVKYQEDEDADKEIKYRDDGDREGKDGDDKYHEDGEKANRREDKYREDGDRDTRRKDYKFRDDGGRDGRCRDDKYWEDSERENKRRNEKYREEGDKDSRRINDRHYEDVERGDRYRDDKEERRREDYGRDSRQKDGKQGDDADREKRPRDAKYKVDRTSGDRSGDKTDVKHSRVEIHTADLHSWKLNVRDNSPNSDDRGRLKDDQGRKRNSDKDGQIDTKSRSAKDHQYDAEKRSTSLSRVDLISDKGRSTSQNADLELTPNCSRNHGSPSSSSHVTRQHYRRSKKDESKNREYGYEDRARHGVTTTRDYASASGVTEKFSSSRVIEKVRKDDSHLVELSAERHLITDARSSPRQLIDKSPRHVGRSNVRRSGSKEVKDFSGKESRGNHDFGMEMFPGDDLSQADGDSLAVSSPFARTGNLSGSSKSFLPPFRTGVDNPLNFGSSEDDSRMKFSTRHRRISDPNMGRVQGSPWKGVPSWTSPMANGFMPFQHGPPPVGFRTMMQQFPAPPIFGGRPSMELNHQRVAYHVPDAERFTGHGHPMAWRNPVDDSCPPPLHGWDANNAPTGEESHVYGRPDWDHTRTLPGGRGWEASGEMWKGPKSDASMELPFTFEKENRFTHMSMDVALAGQIGEQAQNEQIQADRPAESIETSRSIDALEKITPEDPKVSTTEDLNAAKKSGKDDAHICHVYLSKLDISAGLADPELYSKCTGLWDVEKIISGAEDPRILYLEQVAKVREKISTSNKKGLLCATVTDSVFQKAMTLYKKQREEFVVISGKSTALDQLCNKYIMKSDQGIHLSENNEAEQLLSADEYPNCDEEFKRPVLVPKLEEVSPVDYQKSDEPVVACVLEKSDETILSTRIKEELVADLEFQEKVLHNSLSRKDVGSSAEEQTLPDTKCGSLLLPNVSSRAESIESGSVNLSRIHHSPENTH